MKLKFRRLPSDRSFVFFCYLKIQSRRKISKYHFCVTVLFFGPFLVHFRFDSQFQLRKQLKKYFFLCKFGINHLLKKTLQSKNNGKWEIFLFQRTVFIKSEIKLNVITLIVISFVTVYSIVRNQAKYQKCTLRFSLESTKLSS